MQRITAASVHGQLLLVFVKEFSKLIYFPNTHSLIQPIFYKAFVKKQLPLLYICHSMKTPFIVILLLMAIGVSVNAEHPRKWQLVWSEEFDSETLNSQVWSRIDRGKADWNRHMSCADSLYMLRNGTLVLRGTANGNTEADSARFLTGGVWTKGLKTFEPGRIEIRARLHAAKGAWPALWLLPADAEWPSGGEIDIMERLNYDTIAYQTVHSYYTLRLGKDDNPPHFATGNIDPDGWNVFGVDILPDSLVFHINGHTTFSYPKVDNGKDFQFPFHARQYLLMDMQLGGGWVGETDPATLPVEMEIDWVRHYLPAD